MKNNSIYVSPLFDSKPYNIIIEYNSFDRGTDLLLNAAIYILLLNKSSIVQNLFPSGIQIHILLFIFGIPVRYNIYRNLYAI